ncbi:MAG: AI-2E family transporter [Halobacteriota archaeon]
MKTRACSYCALGTMPSTSTQTRRGGKNIRGRASTPISSDLSLGQLTVLKILVFEFGVYSFARATVSTFRISIDRAMGRTERDTMATDALDEVFGGRLPPLALLLIMGASGIIILAAMKAAAEIVAPTLFAIFLALLASPLLHRLERRGLSTNRALAVMITGALGFVAGVIALIYASLSRVFSQASIVSTNPTLETTQSTLSSLTVNTTALQPVNLLSDKFALQASIVILRLVSSVVLQLILLVTLFIFFLIALPRIQTREIADYVQSHPISGPLLAIRQKLVDFVVIRTKVNAYMAIPATVFLLIAGIDFALLWGVLLFVFSFIPYIGFILATIPPALLGWVEYGPIGAVAVVVVFVVINFVAEYVLFPRYAGEGLNIPAYVVLLSVVFWGWILGPLGTLIAIPVTLLLRVLLSNYTEASWLVDLLGGEDKT